MRPYRKTVRKLRFREDMGSSQADMDSSSDVKMTFEPSAFYPMRHLTYSEETVFSGAVSKELPKLLKGCCRVYS